MTITFSEWTLLSATPHGMQLKQTVVLQVFFNWTTTIARKH